MTGGNMLVGHDDDDEYAEYDYDDAKYDDDDIYAEYDDDNDDEGKVFEPAPLQAMLPKYVTANYIHEDNGDEYDADSDNDEAYFSPTII